MSNKELWEGFVSAAQRKAVWASKADGGKGHPDNKKKKSRKDDYQSLIKAINIYFEEQLLKSDKTFRTHLVRFESEFGMVK